MAITTDQKADLLSKKIAFNKAMSSLETAFFEEPIGSKKAVFKSDIYSQSELIPSTAVVVPGIVEQVTDLSLQYIVGEGSTAFYNPALTDVIPFTYGDGSSYMYTLKTDANAVIPFGLNNWYLDPESGVLIFFDGFPSGVSATTPPKISCYKYVGTTGDIGGVQEHPIKELFTPSTNQTVFILAFVPIYLLSFSVNGVEQLETTDYTWSGSVVIWVSSDFSLGSSDSVVIKYYK